MNNMKKKQLKTTVDAELVRGVSLEELVTKDATSNENVPTDFIQHSPNGLSRSVSFVATNNSLYKSQVSSKLITR